MYGVAFDASTGAPVALDVHGPVELALLREGAGGESLRYETETSADGSFGFDGVAPGRWRLECARSAEASPVVLLVAEGDAERVVDVRIR